MVSKHPSSTANSSSSRTSPRSSSLAPSASSLFRKVYELVLLVESLPVRFDGAIDGLEVFVADVMSGVMGFVPKRCCRADVFRDIRCDEEEGVLHRAVVDEVRAMEKRCEDVTRKVVSVEIVTVDGGGDDDGGTGDPTETIGVGSAEKAIGDTEHDEKTERDVVQGARPETEEQEVSCDVMQVIGRASALFFRKRRQHVRRPRNRRSAVKIQQELSRARAKERQTRRIATSHRVAKNAPRGWNGTAAPWRLSKEWRHTAEIMEAMQGMEIVEVENQEAASREGGSSKREKAISMSGRESKVDAFFQSV